MNTLYKGNPREFEKFYSGELKTLFTMKRLMINDK